MGDSGSSSPLMVMFAPESLRISPMAKDERTKAIRMLMPF